MVEQPRARTFAVPGWDSASREAVRTELAALSRQQHIDSGRMFGARGEVEPLAYLIGAATGWGGLPRAAAVYESGAVARNDGQSVYRLTVRNVPVDGFWSVSVYNRAGYFEKNQLDACSVNNLTAAPNADGSVTIQFGGCNRNIANCLPVMPGWTVMPGWNYTVRLYRPRPEVLSSAWSFPNHSRSSDAGCARAQNRTLTHVKVLVGRDGRLGSAHSFSAPTVARRGHFRAGASPAGTEDRARRKQVESGAGARTAMAFRRNHPQEWQAAHCECRTDRCAP